MRLEIRRVYDALKPCPRTGNPICLCEFTQDGVLFPEEAEFEGQEIAIPDQETLDKFAEKVTNPRTGQPGWLFSEQNEFSNEMWTQYPRTGYLDGQNADVYAANGAAHRLSSTTKKPGSNLSNSDGVLKYYPDKLIALLKREPTRIPHMTAEITAAGLTVDGVLEAIRADKKDNTEESCGCEEKSTDSNP